MDGILWFGWFIKIYRHTTKHSHQNPRLHCSNTPYQLGMFFFYILKSANSPDQQLPDYNGCILDLLCVCVRSVLSLLRRPTLQVKQTRRITTRCMPSWAIRYIIIHNREINMSGYWYFTTKFVFVCVGWWGAVWRAIPRKHRLHCCGLHQGW